MSIKEARKNVRDTVEGIVGEVKEAKEDTIQTVKDLLPRPFRNVVKRRLRRG